MSKEKSSTVRFSDRVDDYIKYRPGYSSKLIDLLKEKLGLHRASIIADIGSGTGKSSEIFIENGNKVFAVEPNKEMREAAESIFAGDPNFISIDGSGENTNLNDKSVDVIFCGQAFHWLDKTKSKIEFGRILKPNGHIILAWNDKNQNDPLQKEYESILRKNITEYREERVTNIQVNEIKDFFSPKILQEEVIADNFQLFTKEALKGRLRSSSYCPKDGPVYDAVMKDLDQLFDTYEKTGLVKFVYDTKIFWC